MPVSGRIIDLCSRHAWLWGAVALAATLHLLVVWRSPVIALDGITFIEMAEALDENPRQTLRIYDQHPGYPALMLVTAKAGRTLFGNSEMKIYVWAGRFVSGVCGLVSVVLVWLLTRRLFDESIAGIAAMVFAVVPLIRQNAADVLSDTPHLAFYLLAAWCLTCGLSSARASWFVAGGAASGLAFWIRPEGLSVALVGAALSVCWLMRPVGIRRLRIAWCIVASAGAAALVVAPYLLWAGKFTSKKQPLATQQRLPSHLLPYVHDAAPGAAVAATVPAVSNAPQPPVAHPAINATFSRLLRAGAKYVEEVAYGFRYLLLVPLACGHFAVGRIRPQMTAYTLVWSLAILHSALLLWLHFSAGYIGHRHVIPLIALGMPFVASGGSFVFHEIGRLWSRRWSWSVAIVAVSLVAVFFIPRALRPLNYASQPVMDAAAWVERHGNLASRVLANSLYIRYYADMPVELLGIGTPDIETALANSSSPNPYEFVILEVDARRFIPPNERLRALGYSPVNRFDGGSGRQWHQVVVYRRESHTARTPAEAQMATESGATRF